MADPLLVNPLPAWTPSPNASPSTDYHLRAASPAIGYADPAYALPFDMAADPNSVLAPYYTANAFPVQLVLRASNMTIAYSHTGPADTLKAAIDAVLAAP